MKPRTGWFWAIGMLNMMEQMYIKVITIIAKYGLTLTHSTIWLYKTLTSSKWIKIMTIIVILTKITKATYQHLSLPFVSISFSASSFYSVGDFSDYSLSIASSINPMGSKVESLSLSTGYKGFAVIWIPYSSKTIWLIVVSSCGLEGWSII